MATTEQIERYYSIRKDPDKLLSDLYDDILHKYFNLRCEYRQQQVELKRLEALNKQYDNQAKVFNKGISTCIDIIKVERHKNIMSNFDYIGLTMLLNKAKIKIQD